MKHFAVVSLLAMATAQTNEPQTQVNFPTNVFGAVSADGYINEIVQTNDEGTKSAVLWAAWTTTCNDCNFQNGALVQNWA